jgi:peptidyl-prolyl cis-trans isomerase B (cyclophilin B)
MFCLAGKLKFSLMAFVLAFFVLSAFLLTASSQQVSAQGGAPSKPLDVDDTVVQMDTSRGPIRMRIFNSLAPNTAANFLDLVNRGFYNGLTFHRVESWCVQGGCPNGNGTGDFIDPQTGRPRYIRLECSRYLHHKVGVVAMARRANNTASGSCQFYIVKENQPFLDGQYSIFGVVLDDGMNTVNTIGIGDKINNIQIIGTSNMRSSQAKTYTPVDTPGQYNSNEHSNAGTPRDSGF